MSSNGPYHIDMNFHVPHKDLGKVIEVWNDTDIGGIKAYTCSRGIYFDKDHAPLTKTEAIALLGECEVDDDSYPEEEKVLILEQSMEIAKARHPSTVEGTLK